MTTQDMTNLTKADNLFALYYQLENNGQKREAQKYLAKLFSVTPLSFKVNYLGNNYIPEKFDESVIDKGIEYLQNQIKLNQSY
jgi:hypothetical protein